MAARPKALLFDIGEVLVRLKKPQFLASLTRESPELDSVRFLEDLRHPDSLHAAYERGLITGREFHRHLRESYGLGLDYEAWIRHWNDYFLVNRPMEVLLAKLRGQAPFYALSNTNREHLTALKRDFRLFEGFKEILASFELGLRKPEPAMYQAALKRMGVQAGEAFYLDDVPEYVEAARALGIPSFHYTFNDLELKARLRKLGFDFPEWESRPSSMAC
jgi:HAD superfamily hydrolase (TIGR01509 family)